MDPKILIKDVKRKIREVDDVKMVNDLYRYINFICTGKYKLFDEEHHNDLKKLYENVYTKVKCAFNGDFEEGKVVSKACIYWIVDSIPETLLKKYKLKRYNLIKTFEELNFECELMTPKHETGVKKGSFLECDCKKNSNFVVYVEKLPKENTRYYQESLRSLFHETLISLFLTLLKKKGISHNFVHTSFFTTNKGRDTYYRIMEDAGIQLYDFIDHLINELNTDNDFEKFRLKIEIIITQILYAIYCSYKIFGFVHNDLALRNIMVKSYDKKSKQTYVFNEDITIGFKTTDFFLVKIIDFGESVIDKKILTYLLSDKNSPDEKIFFRKEFILPMMDKQRKSVMETQLKELFESLHNMFSYFNGNVNNVQRYKKDILSSYIIMLSKVPFRRPLHLIEQFFKKRLKNKMVTIIPEDSITYKCVDVKRKNKDFFREISFSEICHS